MRSSKQVAGGDQEGAAQPCLLLRVEEAAERLAVSRATLYRRIAAGDLRTLTVGVGCTRVAVAEVERYATQLMIEAGMADLVASPGTADRVSGDELLVRSNG
jgi:excisionase family DNA binding protein